MVPDHAPPRKAQAEHPDGLTVALEAAFRGWPVFPLRAGSKVPAIRAAHPIGDPLRGRCKGECGRSGHGCHDATTDADRIRRWPGWRPDGRGDNVGIATGPAGLLVVDLDVPKAPDTMPPPAWRLPGVVDGVDVFACLAERAGVPVPWATRTVITPRGGLHLYFRRTIPADPRADLGCTAGERGGLGWAVDTRGAGGYVVAPGCVVDGRPYELLADIDPLPLPTWIAERLRALPATARRPASPREMRSAVDSVRRRSRYAAAALERELDRVLSAPVGQRNHTLNAAAYALGRLVAGGLIPEHLATEALTRAGIVAGLSEHETTSTIASGLRAGARTPRSTTA
jgi:hypothetical protein